jgi:hypothetical protein
MLEEKHHFQFKGGPGMTTTIAKKSETNDPYGFAGRE